MMKRPIRTALSLATSVALFAASTGVAFAAQPGEAGDKERKHRLHRGAGMHPAGDPGRMVRHLTRRLELDQVQQEKIENIVAAKKPDMEALRERSDANRKAMRELDSSDSNYDDRLEELVSEKGSIAAEQALLHGRLKAEVDSVLTPEQRQELAEAASGRRDRLHKRKGN